MTTTRKGKGWVTKRPKTGSGKPSWQAGYRRADGSKATKTFKTEAAGIEWIQDEQSRANRGFTDSKSGDQTLAAYWSAWTPRKPYKVKTADDRNYVWAKWIAPYLGDVKLRALSVDSMERYFAQIREAKASPGVQGKVVRYLSPVLFRAEKRGLIARNPLSRFETVQRQPGRKKEPIAIDAAAVVKLSAAVQDRWSAGILVLGFGGLRVGELFALRVSDFDAKAGTVSVSKNVVEVGGPDGMVEQDTTKGGKPRVVQLPDFVVNAVKFHARRFSEAANPSAVLFPPSRGGRWMRANNFTPDVVRPAARAIGLPEGFTAHDLRHSAGSILLDLGFTLPEVQSILGHAKLSTTADIYVHQLRAITPEKVGRVEAAIQAALSGGDVADDADEAKGTR